MHVLYCHDNIYQQCPDGIVYSPGQFPYKYWETFLKDFDHLTIAGRGIDIKTTAKKLNVSSGPNVSFALFPNINTPMGRLKYGGETYKNLEKTVAEADAVIIRAVSDLGWMVYKHAKRMNKPLAMEMAACAWDSTWHHGSRYGKVYAPIRFMRDRIITANADYVMYVSEHFLQARYPTNAATAHASNVRIDIPDHDLTQDRLEAIRQKDDTQKRPSVIGLIGNLNNKIKGVADTIDALALVEKKHPGSFIFRHLGPGNPDPYLRLAEKRNISHLIHFDGMRKSGQEVLDWLHGMDLYLQPSYQEGVPRATIEAMSLACPVIASTAGGIPELIDKKWLIKPGDAKHLAELIIEMLDSPQCQFEAGLENYNHSLNYTHDKLIPRREAFWKEFALFAKNQQT